MKKDTDTRGSSDLLYSLALLLSPAKGKGREKLVVFKGTGKNPPKPRTPEPKKLRDRELGGRGKD